MGGRGRAASLAFPRGEDLGSFGAAGSRGGGGRGGYRREGSPSRAGEHSGAAPRYVVDTRLPARLCTRVPPPSTTCPIGAYYAAIVPRRVRTGRRGPRQTSRAEGFVAGGILRESPRRERVSIHAGRKGRGINGK